MGTSRRRWPLSALVPWPAQVFVLLPFGLGLAATFVTVETHSTSATASRRRAEDGLATLEALFGGPGPGHDVRWMWLLWTGRALLAFAVVAAVVGAAVWRRRVRRGRGERPAS